MLAYLNMYSYNTILCDLNKTMKLIILKILVLIVPIIKL